jgi:serine/threonine protein kinase
MCEEKPYNEKTDVWAMGCLIYELCTGRHPFEAKTQPALALKIIVGKYTPIPAQYSETLVWLVRLCLSVDYKRRPTIEYLLAQQSKSCPMKEWPTLPRSMGCQWRRIRTRAQSNPQKWRRRRRMLGSK